MNALDFPFPAPVVLVHCKDCDVTTNAFAAEARAHDDHDTNMIGDSSVD